MPTKTKTKIDFESLTLKSGSHTDPREGMCVLEAVAYFRGIPHTDRPPCVSPAIGAFLRSWNDSLPDDDRQKLKPYVFKVVGTATTPEDEQRRAWLATDWLVRTCAPAWLDLAGLKDHAARLRALPQLTTIELADAALGEIKSARSAAAAARAAAGAAVGAAAWDAAGDALQATVVVLQTSAFELLDRLIAVGKTEDIPA